MVFDFAARPPEINSTLIYTGAGAGPMMAAAASFGNLSSELATNAAAYESVISQLTGSEWQGPSSAAMAASAQQNVEWLQTTSAQLTEAAAKATASAAAYEAAFSASIPPPVVYANRAQLAILVATNILGQNTPAIAANEAMYGEFWAQDATAMAAYAAAASTASQVTPLQEPVQSTNPGGSAAQGAAVANAAGSNSANTGANQLLGQLTNASAAAAQPGAAPAATIGDLWNAIQGTAGIPLFSNGFNSFDVTLSWCIMMMASALGTLNALRGRRPLRRHDRRCRSAGRGPGLWHHAGRIVVRPRRRNAGRDGLRGGGRRDVGAGRLVGGRSSCHHRGDVGRYRLDRGR